MLSRILLAVYPLTQVAAQSSLVFTTWSAGNVNSDDAATYKTALPECATFHGTYESTSVYAIDGERCHETDETRSWLNTMESGSVVPAGDFLSLDSTEILLHVQPARIQGAPEITPEAWSQYIDQHISTIIWQIEEQRQKTTQSHQQVLAGPAATARPQLLHLDKQKPAAFYSLARSSLPIVDSLFPSNSVLVSVSQDPLPPPQLAEKVPQWLLDSLRDVHYSPLVDAILQDVNPSTLEKDVRHLTAEDGHSDWRTRHSFTEDGRRAGQWIKALVEKEAGVKCRFHEHDEGFSPNVICQFRGMEHPDDLVILGAHYDSRGTFGQVRAPGGDDDASGVSALLSIARLFESYNIQFKRTVVLAFFSGEEQGLWGSRGYAKLLKEENRNVRLMLQADMLGYHAPGEPMQLAFPDQHDTIEARWLVGNLSMTYVPDLQVGTTPACCSDHQSFNQQGFVSTWVFERNGPIADPKYHNSGDLSDREGYDFKQIAAIARVMLATVLTVADFTL